MKFNKMQDVIPWSLIWGYQNLKHQKELASVRKKGLRVGHSITHEIFRQHFNSFCDKNSDVFFAWIECVKTGWVDNITIDIVLSQLLKENAGSYHEGYWSGVYTWQSEFLKEYIHYKKSERKIKLLEFIRQEYWTLHDVQSWKKWIASIEIQRYFRGWIFRKHFHRLE